MEMDMGPVGDKQSRLMEVAALSKALHKCIHA